MILILQQYLLKYINISVFYFENYRTDL